ncbi:PEP-CTERM sorting domain-containing protein [Rubellimicrobium arenae]|uniref:PEP-CTERM sorting domain-containing protein n=1 Tax=Rubellimicrobium arenae TaxID=2817372 RepID=UPI001B310255|nr:PEP-CTERM sorting domain-containing protein [Rubellimicrobium arenae]
MLKGLCAVSLAAALAFLPLMASAVTLSDTNSIVVGQSVDLRQDSAWHWDANFSPKEAGATYTFFFHNSGRRTRTLDFVANVRQLSAYFKNGVTIAFDTYKLSAKSTDRQKGLSTDEMNYLTFAANETKTLTITFGSVVRYSGTTATNAMANINFDAITPSAFAPDPVPLPASSGLLGLGLIGLIGLRGRRRA